VRSLGANVVLPSVMSADLMRVGEQVDALIAAGARSFHVDVMDAHFVPNLTLGSDFAVALSRPVHAANGAVDVHLMVERPAAMIAAFAAAADAISIHVEADPHPHRLLGLIRELGCAAGLALNPGTAVSAIEPLAEMLDFVNLLAVNPGFSGQSFISTTLGRVAVARELLPAGTLIQVDGGVDPDTLPAVRDAGADLFVAGSAVFHSADPVAAYTELAALARG
jgi:ribulose-phosphate 3-epimerase